jgi:hypothetical protein
MPESYRHLTCEQRCQTYALSPLIVRPASVVRLPTLNCSSTSTLASIFIELPADRLIKMVAFEAVRSSAMSFHLNCQLSCA